MYVVMNVLKVPEAAKSRMSAMFSRAAENMKKVPGFVEFQFLESVNEDKQIVYTKWENAEAFEAWRASDAFAKAHASDRTSESPATGSSIEIFSVVHHS